jgi:NAD(P)-dependent dehydrogenase (short-subunit alcohol dehydrogenase family)
MSRFVGKAVLVTGGNSGIGRAAAAAFASEGGSVMIAARNEDRSADVVGEITGAGGTAAAVRCDVTSPADCEAAVTATVEHYGSLDVLFNNAPPSRSGMQPSRSTPGARSSCPRRPSR